MLHANSALSSTLVSLKTLVRSIAHLQIAIRTRSPVQCGFSCKMLSKANARSHLSGNVCEGGEGSTGETCDGMLKFIDKIRPIIVIAETCPSSSIPILRIGAISRAGFNGPLLEANMQSLHASRRATLCFSSAGST